MARIQIVSTHGSADPTRATLPWLLAKGAIESGHQPQILLAGDAAILAHRTVVENVQGVGIPALRDLVGFAMEHKVPVFV